MIELIIDIADYLHVPVVAEGVETEEQYLVLKAMGCDLVQGYYFSKPVPPEDFDRFLVERSGENTAVTPEVKKTYMTISKALTSDFESIFYVDMISEYYLEFYAGTDGKLEIRPGGTDFFTGPREKLLEEVCDEDRDGVRAATDKDDLLHRIGRDEPMVISFRRLRNGQAATYSLQTIKTRESDDHHIVVGIRQVK